MKYTSRGKERLYRSNVAEHFAKIADNSINVFIAIYKAVPLAISDLADDVESVELKPLGKVTHGVR